MKLRFREATYHDKYALWSWVNHESSLAGKINTTDRIAFGKHVKWLQERLDNPDHHIWIVELDMHNGITIGQVRLEYQKTHHEIDIFIIPEARQEGFAGQAIQYVLDFHKENYPMLEVRAEVISSNSNSHKLFRSAGPVESYGNCEKDTVVYTWR